MISDELQKEIATIPEFGGLELSPPMTISEVAKSLYVNWDIQIRERENPWRSWAQMSDGLVNISVRGKTPEDAIARLKREIKRLN